MPEDNRWQKLVYDVGVHNGDDSAYYLHKGFKVVGIEANPLALPLIRERFKSELRDGLFVLVPAGIAQSQGHAPFWICDDHPKWSSFDRSIASRFGARHHCVTVPTCRFKTVLERFGAATYCKIDIEGNDDLCLEDLSESSKPRYLSVELLQGDRQLARLKKLGYTRFKIVSQRTFREPSSLLLALKTQLWPGPRRLLSAGEAALTRYGSDGSWRFPRGSSGPFGKASPGRWRTYDDTRALLSRILAVSSDLSEWHDIHAAHHEQAT
jgi:FkbM family methyltransferase